VETFTRLLKAHGLPTHRPPTSPGEMVAHFLEDLGLSQAEVARALGLTANRLNEVVKGKRGISADPSTSAFASPKSSTFTRPSSVSLMLAGLRSRWMIP